MHGNSNDDDDNVRLGQLIREIRELLASPRGFSDENRRLLRQLLEDLEAEFHPDDQQ